MASRGSLQTSRRVSELLLDLLCRLEPNPSHSRRPSGGLESEPHADLSTSIKKYVGVIKKHTYVTPNEAAILRSFEGVVEKLALSGRKSESVVLGQYKNLFFSAYVESQSAGCTGVAAYDSEFSVPHAMLQLLLLLAHAPTQSVDHFRVHKLNEALFSTSGASRADSLADTDAEEGGSDAETGGILRYDDWRQQCLADDDLEITSGDETSWNSEDDDQDRDRRQSSHNLEDVMNAMEDQFADNDDAYIEVIAPERNMEYLKYGLHVSQRGALASELYGSRDVHEALAHFDSMQVQLLRELSPDERVQWVHSTRVPHHDDDLVLNDGLICKYILELLGGYQNDLFIREQGSEKIQSSDANRIGRNSLKTIASLGDSWSKSSTCLRVAAIGTTRETCQVVLDWFLRFANDIQYCRSIIDTVMDQLILPIGVDVQKLGILAGRKLDFSDKTLLLELLSYGGDSLIPLYSSVYDEIVKLDAFLSELQLQLHNKFQGAKSVDFSIIGLYLTMKSRKALFSSITGSLRGVLLAIDNYSDTDLNLVDGFDEADLSNSHYTPHHKASVDDLLPALLQYVLDEASASWVVNLSAVTDPVISRNDGVAAKTERDKPEMRSSNDEANLTLALPMYESPLWGMYCAALTQRLIEVEVTSVALHAGHKLTRKGSVSGKPTATTSQSKNRTGGLLPIWKLAAECELDFDVLAKFPMVLNRIFSTDSNNTVSNFKSISTYASHLFKFIFGVNAGDSTTTVIHRVTGSEIMTLENRDGANPSFCLFRNDPCELKLICAGWTQLLGSKNGESEIEAEGYDQADIDGVRGRGEFSILSGASLLSVVIVRPIVSMIHSVAALAATTVLDPRGFNLVGHLEYLRLLFFMGGEVFGRETDKLLHAFGFQNRNAKSPGSVLVTIQEVYKSLLGRYTAEQHNSAFSGEIFLQLRAGPRNVPSLKRSRPMNFEVELYSASISLSNTLQQTISTCHDGGATASGVQRAGGAVSNIAVAASFTPSLSNAHEETQASRARDSSDVPRDLRASNLPSNAAASLYISDLICDNLSIDMSYPFPLNKVISPDRIHRMLVMYRYLLKISCWLYAAEETWKIDSVSIKLLTACCASGWSTGSAALLVEPLTRCRVSLYWILHTVKGIQYYFLSDIHDVLWLKLQAEIASSGKLCTANLVNSFDGFLSGVERLLSLYESQVMDVLRRGHVALSSYRLALLLCDSIIETYDRDQVGANASAEGVKGVLLSRCALLLKKADAEFASAREAVTSFLAILGMSSAEGYRSGLVSKLRRYNELNTVDMSALDVANETRKLHSILGGHWNTHPGLNAT